ncbi:hypothetical protein SAMD00019534_065080 [Acytostelium subglobosum LB1]|uniref:hypothetical protein n=1 Tax=Acytostelium subglobosum LB1 TaxID=1410327 RepID=UPI000644A7A6|nr:hypothetical protein SAMD00019534_065080 [Acytostelium subglobosum LB1]GAM23333.1 hypothetical protein SAMD00019534_065080 [Acytostelium subglobosum LB1]|eukprot:XP_012753782.1 hypothetical protein SAMD00019534_065080 [Acytostelium subglobosum LB1]
MDWAPHQDGLNQLVNILKQTNSSDQETQRKIQSELKTFNKIPDYNNYLTYIFKLQHLDAYVRNVSGLLLKQNIKNYYQNMPRVVQEFIKREIVPVLSDPLQNVRHTVANIITNLISRSSFEDWKELLPMLMSGLDSPDQNVVEGALYTLSLLCEDFTQQLDSEKIGRPLNQLIPKLLMFLKSTTPVFRGRALSSLHFFIPHMPGALLINMESYLLGIFSLSDDANSDIRVKVCRSLVSLVSLRMDFLMTHIKQIIQYMLHASKDSNEDVALEACEFWSAIADSPHCEELLKEFLPVLIPILLNGMVYTVEEYESFENEEDTANIPDRPQDIKPFFVNSKVHTTGPSQGQGFVQGEQPQQQEDDDDDYDDDDDFADDESWSIRKSSALALDTLSSIFDAPTYLSIALPLIEQKMHESNQWMVRESAILALGAIAEGCLKGLSPHLPKVIPYLINMLNDPKPLVRSITCWALSRYSHWISVDGVELIPLLIGNLLNRILDNNKRVQEAACSAFATIEEDADRNLIPFLPNILTTFVQAFQKYQAKNLLILYDAISTLAKVIGKDMNKPEYINVLMPPLLHKFQSLEDDNKNLLPLLQCLTPICSSVGLGLSDVIIVFYNRALKIIIETLTAIKIYKETEDDADEPDKDFIVSALDLISGLTDGVGTSIEGLVANSNLPLVLLECMRDSHPDVRQSSFALLGDLSKFCIVHFKTLIPEYIPILTLNLYPDHVPVCNNACWALGEISVRLPQEIKPHVKDILAKLIPIMQNVKLNRNILENTAITLGRMGLVSADVCAPRIEEFIQCWCMAIRAKIDDQEKDSAFRGMWVIISNNPSGALKHLIYICDAIASWNKLETDLNDAYRRLLHVFKESIGQHWPQYYAQFPLQLRKILNERYQLE